MLKAIGEDFAARFHYLQSENQDTRVERVQLEEFIQRMYADTRAFVDEHPFVEVEAEPGASDR